MYVCMYVYIYIYIYIHYIPASAAEVAANSSSVGEGAMPQMMASCPEAFAFSKSTCSRYASLVSLV